MTEIKIKNGDSSESASERARYETLFDFKNKRKTLKYVCFDASRQVKYDDVRLFLLYLSVQS